ncbi:MAG: hypothetical protein ACYTEQ_29070, partial [Planctomycetota bacterium]
MKTAEEHIDNDVCANCEDAAIAAEVTQIIPAEQVELSVEVAEQLMVSGNLAPLKPEQRIAYYRYVCEKSGLDYSCQPFEYIKFQGKVILYARKGCAEQLRRIHGISIIETQVEQINGMFLCHCTVKNKEGRTETDVGAVPVGNDPSNAIMKAVTKAKRRATLGICGLGTLEEAHPTEWADTEMPEPKTKILLENGN